VRSLIIAIAVIASVTLGGFAAWHAKAAAPAASVPIAGPYTPVHPAACNGWGACPPGRHRVCGPGGNCWCAPC
jgi:hypothetical protein